MSAAATLPTPVVDPTLTAALNGPQRAAVLLLMLGLEYGSKVWTLLEEEEIQKVSFAMSQLGVINSKTCEALLVDFVSHLSASGSVTGSIERTEELLGKVFPQQQVASIMSDIKGASGKRMWERLSHVDADVLANYLRSEYPQTVAVILSKLKTDHAARVLAIFPEEFAVDVVGRMLKMEDVQKEAMDHIEQTLRTEFVSTIRQTPKRDPHEAMAELFNMFDRQTESRFLEALDTHNRTAARRIRELMFTFEDLTKLDPGSAQTFMRGIDKGLLAKALKGAADPVRDFFFGNMSTRAVKNLQDDMQALGPMRLKDVDEAQVALVNLARSLADKGEITISKGGGEEELIY